MKVIKLPCYGMVINIGENGSGAIVSDLTAKAEEEGANFSLTLSALDGLESLVLAHACAGIDVESPAYLEGIETAVDAIINEINWEDE